MLGDVARQPGQLRGELHEFAPARGIDARGELGVALDLLMQLGSGAVGPGELREPAEFGLRQAERFADIAHGAAQAVGGEGGDQRGVVAAPVLVDALDQPRADVAREIEVDIGQRVQLFVEEAAEIELVGDRIDVREADQVADDRGDGGAAAAADGQVGAPARGLLAADLVGNFLGQLKHLVVDEEEAGQVVALDQPQLLLQAGVGQLLIAGPRVALEQPLAAELFEAPDRGLAAGQLGAGQSIAEVCGDVELAAPGDAHAVGGGLRVVGGVALGLFGG